MSKKHPEFQFERGFRNAAYSVACFMGGNVGQSKSDTTTQGTSTNQNTYDPDRYYTQQLLADEMNGSKGRGITGQTYLQRGGLKGYPGVRRGGGGGAGGPGNGQQNPDGSGTNLGNGFNGDPSTGSPDGSTGAGGPSTGPQGGAHGGHLLPQNANATTSPQGATTTGGQPIQGDPMQGQNWMTSQGTAHDLPGYQNATNNPQLQAQLDAQAQRAAAIKAEQEYTSPQNRPSTSTPSSDPSRGLSGTTTSNGAPATTDPNARTTPLGSMGARTTGNVSDSGTVTAGGNAGGTLPPGGGTTTIPGGYVNPNAGGGTNPGYTAPPPVPSAGGGGDPGSPGGGGNAAPPPTYDPYSLTEAGPPTSVDAHGNPVYEPGVNAWNAGGASGNRELAGGQAFSGFSQMANHGGYDDATKNAITQEGMNAAKSTYSGAASRIGMNSAATGNSAGMAAAMSQLGRDEANTLGQQGRQNQIDFANEKQKQKQAGLTGLAGLNSNESNYMMGLFGQRAGLSSKPTESLNTTNGTGNYSGGNYGISL